MSDRHKKSRAKVHAAKPEPPPFLQRIREQIVANEGADRREQAEKRRRDRPIRQEDSDSDDPAVVKVHDNDLTEKEYKRMKTELETKYKIEDTKKPSTSFDLDIDMLMNSRKIVRSQSDNEQRNKLADSSKAKTSGRRDDTKHLTTSAHKSSSKSHEYEKKKSKGERKDVLARRDTHVKSNK